MSQSAEQPRYKDEEWLQEQFEVNLRDVEAVADECGVSIPTIYNWVGKFGIETSPHTDRKWLYQKLIDDKLRYSEVADLVGVNTSTISMHANNMGIAEEYRDWRNIGIEGGTSNVDIDEEELRRIYYVEERTIEEAAEYFGIGTDTLYIRLKKYDIPTGNLTSVYCMNGDGYVVSASSDDSFYLHRLLAVSEFGFDAVKGKEVHHQSLCWDNRPEAIELLTTEEHGEIEEWPDEHEIHEVPRPPDPDQKQVDEFTPEDPLVY